MVLLTQLLLLLLLFITIIIDAIVVEIVIIVVSSSDSPSLSFRLRWLFLNASASFITDSNAFSNENFSEFLN